MAATDFCCGVRFTGGGGVHTEVSPALSQIALQNVVSICQVIFRFPGIMSVRISPPPDQQCTFGMLGSPMAAPAVVNYTLNLKFKLAFDVNWRRRRLYTARIVIWFQEGNMEHKVHLQMHWQFESVSHRANLLYDLEWGGGW